MLDVGTAGSRRMRSEAYLGQDLAGLERGGHQVDEEVRRLDGAGAGGALELISASSASTAAG